MDNKAWTLRYTAEREALIERLREKLDKSDRPVHTIHGIVTNAYIFDEALKALDRELAQEVPDDK